MRLWIIASVAIVLIITVAAAVTMLLLAAQSDKQEQIRTMKQWNLELWNIAKGYRVNLSFENSLILGRANLIPASANPTEQDVTVSRQHCMLYEQDGMLLVWNLSAVNPADLNGHRLNAPQFLAPGDRLKLGHSVFLVTRVEYI